MNILDSLTYFFLKVLKGCVSTISPLRRYKLSNAIASLIYNYTTLRKEQARKNITRAFPKLTPEKIEKILKDNYLFFCYNFFQFISFPRSWEGLNIKVIGEKKFKKFIQQNKGLILVSGHFGAWEILGKWVAENVELFSGVAQKQKNRGAHKFFIEQRELPGTKHIMRKEPITKMYDVLEKGGVLGLVSDQDAKSKGVFVNFFGTPASTSKGAAIFNLNTSAPLLVGVCIRLKLQTYQINFVPVEIENPTVDNITQAYTSILENFIKKKPEQYFWFHRRWKTKNINDKNIKP